MLQSKWRSLTLRLITSPSLLLFFLKVMEHLSLNGLQIILITDDVIVGDLHTIVIINGQTYDEVSASGYPNYPLAQFDNSDLVSFFWNITVSQNITISIGMALFQSLLISTNDKLSNRR